MRNLATAASMPTKICGVLILSISLAACGGGSSGGGGSNSGSSSSGGSGTSSGGSSSGGSSSGGTSSGSSSGGTDTNRPPTIDALSISPQPAYTDSRLIADLTATDEDGEDLAITYEWRVNGSLIDEEFSRSLNSSYFEKGDTVQVTANVSDHASNAERSATTTIQNSAPKASARGDSPVLVNRLVALTGEAQDADADELAYSWTQIAGPAVTLSDKSSASPTFVSPGDFYGELRFALVVSDGEAESDSVQVSVVVENAPPTINSLTLSPAPAYTDTALTANVSATDADSQPLTTHYYWSVNGTPIDGIDNPTLPAENFGKTDEVSVAVEVTDGKIIAKDSASLTISDSTPKITASGVPKTVEYGVPVSFLVQVEDADEEDITDVHFLARPNGMEIDGSGNVTWTPTGPMFDSHMDVNWEVAATQNGNVTASIGSSIVVEDADRLPPVARSGLHTSTNLGAIKAGDFNGDGTNELLITDFSQRLYTLKYDGSDYIQNWMYPYALTSEDGRITTTATGDLDGDDIDEILVGLDEGGYGSSATTRILVIDGVSRKLTNFTTVSGRSIDAIRVADVDNDGIKEIIALVNLEGYSSSKHHIEIRQASDLSLEWQSPALLLGNQLEVGDTDGDDIPEMVFSTGYIFGFNGSSYSNEWLYSDGFGLRFGVADLDADGQSEIIGINSDDQFIRVYDAVDKSVVAQTNEKYTNIALADVDGDSAAEILAIDYYDHKIELLSFDRSSTPQFVADWTFDETSNYPINPLISNVDDDSAPEFIWQREYGDQIAIAGENPDIDFEWINEKSFSSTSHYGGGELANISSEGKRLVFFGIGRTSTDYSDYSHAAKLDIDGKFSWSAALQDLYSNQVIGTTADITGDGTVELLYAHRNTPAAFSFYSDSIIWTAPNMTNSAVAVAKGKLNADTAVDMVITTSDGAINAYDVKNELLLWGLDSGGGRDIKVADLNGDGQVQVIAADYQTVNVFQPGKDSATLQHTLTLADIPADIAGEAASYLGSLSIEQIAIGDIDGDDQKEVVLTASYYSDLSWVVVLNATLRPISMTKINGIARAVAVQNYGDNHRNILVSVAPRSYSTKTSRFLEIDPISGAIVSESPQLLGRPQKNDMHFVDFDGDGIPELSYGTNQAMNFTR